MQLKIKNYDWKDIIVNGQYIGYIFVKNGELMVCVFRDKVKLILIG